MFESENKLFHVYYIPRNMQTVHPLKFSYCFISVIVFLIRKCQNVIFYEIQRLVSSLDYTPYRKILQSMKTVKLGFKMFTLFWKMACHSAAARALDSLTLNVRGPSKLGLTRSISWLLMPWLLASPGHQRPWYWLCRIGRCLSYSRRNFNYLCHISMEEWHKM